MMTAAIAPTLFVLEPHHLMSWRAFWDASEEVLQFPDYFGRNKDAWDECFTDLVEHELSRGRQIEIEFRWPTDAGIPNEIYRLVCDVILKRKLDVKTVKAGSVG